MSLREEVAEGDPSETTEDEMVDPPATVGEYTWDDFFPEFDATAQPLENGEPPDDGSATLGWNSEIDPREVLGFDPEDLDGIITDAGERAALLDSVTYDTFDPDETPVRQGEWTWHHFVRDIVDPEWDGVSLPEDFDPAEWLTFPERDLGAHLSAGEEAANVLQDIVEERTIDVHPELDEEAFFRTPEGVTTIVNRYDLEKAVPLEKKSHFREEERYWVNKPYAFVIIFHSVKENETKYYLIEPYQTSIEEELFEFLTQKLRTSIKYADDIVVSSEEADRRAVIEEKTRSLLERYDIYEDPTNGTGGLIDRVWELLGRDTTSPETPGVDGIGARPEPALLEEDATTLSEYQVEKLLYRLRRDFLGYERIDGIKHDINVEDISCDGYNSPVFVYHTDYEQIISNVYHGKERLDDFVVKLAQRSGKGISKRQPQVDATLPDGSRAQLTLGQEVSDHGTNYTIRQFKDVPFTPIDLINWRTFSLEEMAFIWLCIENHKSLLFAGGTASGKTTSLNAVSLFIPSNSKIVSIEDTREVELPQRNWIASVTRPSFSDDAKGDVDEFDLLEAALRQRPEYIVMGEIRGEEGRTLFQVMSTGHTTYTTFHADSVGEVLKRFTTAPINVSKTMFTALDLVSIQSSTRVRGKKVRRNKSLTEINHYDTENDEINVQDVYQWQAETDEFLRLGDSNTLDEILFDRGWDRERLEEELLKREVVLAYLISNGLNEYRQVAATLQAFITDPETTFSLIATGELEDSLDDLREMESVEINVDPEKEALVPRPDPDEEMRELTQNTLARAEEELFDEYRDKAAGSIADALIGTEPAEDIPAEPGAGTNLVPEETDGTPAGEDEADASEAEDGWNEAGEASAEPIVAAGEEWEERDEDDPFGHVDEEELPWDEKEEETLGRDPDDDAHTEAVAGGQDTIEDAELAADSGISTGRVEDDVEPGRVGETSEEETESREDDGGAFERDEDQVPTGEQEDTVEDETWPTGEPPKRIEGKEAEASTGEEEKTIQDTADYGDDPGTPLEGAEDEISTKKGEEAILDATDVGNDAGKPFDRDEAHVTPGEQEEPIQDATGFGDDPDTPSERDVDAGSPGEQEETIHDPAGLRADPDSSDDRDADQDSPEEERLEGTAGQADDPGTSIDRDENLTPGDRVPETRTESESESDSPNVARDPTIGMSAGAGGERNGSAEKTEDHSEDIAWGETIEHSDEEEGDENQAEDETEQDERLTDGNPREDRPDDGE